MSLLDGSIMQAFPGLSWLHGPNFALVFPIFCILCLYAHLESGAWQPDFQRVLQGIAIMAKKRPSKTTITENDVIQAQENWANAIVEIGHAYTSGADVVACAKGHIKKLYAYDDKVLFKPTKCAVRQFRLTSEGSPFVLCWQRFRPGWL